MTRAQQTALAAKATKDAARATKQQEQTDLRVRAERFWGQYGDEIVGLAHELIDASAASGADALTADAHRWLLPRLVPQDLIQPTLRLLAKRLEDEGYAVTINDPSRWPWVAVSWGKVDRLGTDSVG